MSEQSKEETARGLVLVVEDEPAIADVITRSLTSAGFAVHAERDGDAAIAAADRLRPAAIVLDIGLPGRDGVEICRTLRARGDWTPVLFVTARDDDVDRVIGLEIGADDYIVKPFSPRELAARVKAVLRRTAGQGNGEVWQHHDLRLDTGRREVTVDDRRIHLTGTEFNLLHALLAGRGRVLERTALMASAWGVADYSGSRTVDVHVAQLRAKLGDACPIETVRGVGYRLGGTA